MATDEVKTLSNPPNDIVSGTSDDDDKPILSSHALEALKEFLQEQQNHTEDHTNDNEDVKLVTEDWRLSQFWYDSSTAETVAEEVIELLKNDNDSQNPNSKAAVCIACPTLYAYIKKMEGGGVRVELLEYDKRFEQYGTDFTFYDYNEPLELPSQFKHSFDVVVADPPYLSKECLEKVAQTISFLAKPEKSHLLLLTGEVQTERAAEFLGLHPCGFRPQHSNKLGNEFRLFTNYEPGTRLGGWEHEK
ncbi:uncharacterized protein LOC126676342 [Mercurialis annua]|uniref:uncharacterized protein LOC126676342 n=1 Tax=Mercurialis annua TaxID=3986 RepID=UPI002160B2FD|nr:uncharacterized protein LOC126676342 [Mercurialis annua]XP_050226481.1 uncharacterized protein LOC126676342 [Mercurialis annua]